MHAKVWSMNMVEVSNLILAKYGVGSGHEKMFADLVTN